MTAEDLPPPPPHLLAMADQSSQLLPPDRSRQPSEQSAANRNLLPSTGQLNPAYSAANGMEQYPPEIASFMTRVKGHVGAEAKERGVGGPQISKAPPPNLSAEPQQSPSPSMLRRYKSARGPYKQVEAVNNRRDVRASLPRHSSYTNAPQAKLSPMKEQHVANRGEKETQRGRLQDIFESFDNLFTAQSAFQSDLSPEKPRHREGEESETRQGNATTGNRSRPTMLGTNANAAASGAESFQDQLKSLPDTKKKTKEKVMDWMERSSDLWSYESQIPMLKDQDTGNPLPQYQRPSHLYEDPVQVVQAGFPNGRNFFVDV